MSDASIVWAVIVSFVLLLIAYGIVSSKLSARRTRKRVARYLPEVSDHIQSGKAYRVLLSNGLVLPEVRFQGISSSTDRGADYLPFPLQHWLVLAKPDGKRVFVKPNAVRFYEEL